MRVIVTILASFILALGLLGAGLTMLHTLPRKKTQRDAGSLAVKSAGLEVRPTPIGPRKLRSGPSEASFTRDRKGEHSLSGKIRIPAGAELGVKLLGEESKVGLELRRLQLGQGRDYRFENLPRGQFRLQVHLSDSGKVLIDRRILLTNDQTLDLRPPALHPPQQFRFTSSKGAIQAGAILVLEDGKFFHRRLVGTSDGNFVAADLPSGDLEYTLRGRLWPKTVNLLWKGSVAIPASAQSTERPPLEIRLGDASKDSMDE